MYRGQKVDYKLYVKFQLHGGSTPLTPMLLKGQLYCYLVCSTSQPLRIYIHDSGIRYLLLHTPKFSHSKQHVFNSQFPWAGNQV